MLGFLKLGSTAIARAIQIENNNVTNDAENDVGAGSWKRNRVPSGANANELKLSCELVRQFVVEAVQRAATIAEAEGAATVASTHLERILPQLLFDF
ncbi:hypothetical protein LIER_01525 [Lithospermum erythrorhizon]|uniref:Centromere protein X n=1 Tax=Lithospermum erythrorhizon TaxID=34254 RepID=A0AAV3NM84_LITER